MMKRAPIRTSANTPDPTSARVPTRVNNRPSGGAPGPPVLGSVVAAALGLALIEAVALGVALGVALIVALALGLTLGLALIIALALRLALIMLLSSFIII